MNHSSEGDLRAFLDQELEGPAEARVRAHVAVCPKCAGTLSSLEARAARMEALWRNGDETAPPLSAARSRLRARLNVPMTVKENTLMQRRFKFRYAALATAAILLVALMFPPVQSWAAQVLGLFRVEQVTVLPVDSDTLSGFDDEADTLLTEMLSENVQAEAVGEGREVATWDEARAAAGFPLRTPTYYAEAPAEIQLSPGTKMELTLDAERLRALVAALGREDISIPDSLTGTKVNIEVPQGVQAVWGECRPDRDDGEGTERADGGCTSLIQIPSPTVTTPPDLDMVAMGQLYLEVLGMSREEAASFGSALDWSSTLVIPVPSDEAEYEEVSVDGVSGTLIRSVHGPSGPYMLIWVRDGIIYGVTGVGDGSEGLAIASSLR